VTWLLVGKRGDHLRLTADEIESTPPGGQEGQQKSRERYPLGLQVVLSRSSRALDVG